MYVNNPYVFSNTSSIVATPVLDFELLKDGVPVNLSVEQPFDLFLPNTKSNKQALDTVEFTECGSLFINVEYDNDAAIVDLVLKPPTDDPDYDPGRDDVMRP